MTIRRNKQSKEHSRGIFLSNFFKLKSLPSQFVDALSAVDVSYKKTWTVTHKLCFFFFFFFCNGGILGIWPHNAITYENLYSLIDNIHYAITYENHDNSYLFKHNSCFWVFVFCFFFNDGKALAYLMFNLC
jgi:hypothetical protein